MRYENPSYYDHRKKRKRGNTLISITRYVPVEYTWSTKSLSCDGVWSFVTCLEVVRITWQNDPVDRWKFVGYPDLRWGPSTVSQCPLWFPFGVCHLRSRRFCLVTCSGRSLGRWGVHIPHPTARYLANILGPLVGDDPHNVKNSGDFASKIQDLIVTPGQKLVSYDVSALSARTDPMREDRTGGRTKPCLDLNKLPGFFPRPILCTAERFTSMSHGIPRLPHNC